MPRPDAAAAAPMQYGTALVLLILVLGMSMLAFYLRHIIREKYRW